MAIVFVIGFGLPALAVVVLAAVKTARFLRDCFREANAPLRITDPRGRAWLANRDTCPECLGELDTGWECNDCGYDAQHLIDNGA